MKTPTILLILENPGQLNRYGSYLREHGYETLACASPCEGINCLASHPVSLVIVGQDTPEFEGRPVLEYCVRAYSGVPVLVIARVVDLRWYLDAMELGATDYLEEPEPLDLAWVVETQLLRSGAEARQAPESPSTAGAALMLSASAAGAPIMASERTRLAIGGPYESSQQ